MKGNNHWFRWQGVSAIYLKGDSEVLHLVVIAIWGMLAGLSRFIVISNMVATAISMHTVMVL